MTEPLLVVGPDPEKAVSDYLVSLTVTGGPLEGWGVGTKTPSNATPDKFIQVRRIGGSNPNVLLYLDSVRLRVWNSSEHTAAKTANVALAYLRRGLGARVTNLPVPLPDPVDGSKNFYQCALLLPAKGISAG